MADSIPISSWLAHPQTLIDVRTPAEYASGHIPGSINIPIFTNEERALVGTEYKQVGKQSAIRLAISLTGSKMTQFLDEIDRIQCTSGVTVHCWRGGMRSSAMSWLFELYGYQTQLIEGGYQAYRRWVNQQFELPYKFLVIGGETGSGKTEVLELLRSEGQQIIDLEAMAAHRGSAFGSIGMADQPKNEQFSNELAQKLSEFDPHRPIWLEDESRMIGNVHLPERFWFALRAAPLLVVKVDFEDRLKRLLHTYGQFPIAELEKSFMKIERKIGGQYLKTAIAQLREGDLQAAAQIALRYYDKAYRFGLTKKDTDTIIQVSEVSSQAQIVNQLITIAQSLQSCQRSN